MGRSKHTPAARGSRWIRRSTRLAIYYRDDFACVYCEAVANLSLDHVSSVENDGRDNKPENLVTACVSCNSAKQGLTWRQWLRKLRDRGVNTNAVRRRIARLTARPIDRQRGRLLVQLLRREGYVVEIRGRVMCAADAREKYDELVVALRNAAEAGATAVTLNVTPAGGEVLAARGFVWPRPEGGRKVSFAVEGRGYLEVTLREVDERRDLLFGM